MSLNAAKKTDRKIAKNEPIKPKLTLRKMNIQEFTPVMRKPNKKKVCLTPVTLDIQNSNDLLFSKSPANFNANIYSTCDIYERDLKNVFSMSYY